MKKTFFSEFTKYGLLDSQRRFKCPKIVKIGCFKLIRNFANLAIFWIFFSKIEKYAKNSNFQALLEKKLKVLWKKFLGQKMLKIIQKSHFLYLEVGKTTSGWIFWRKSKNQNFAFLKKTF